MKKGGFIKDAIILCLITLISGVSLGTVYEITKGPIAEAKLNAKKKAYQEVFSEAGDFKENTDAMATITENSQALTELGYGNVGVDEVNDALDKDGNVIGHVLITNSKDGYGGEVQITVGIDKGLKVTGIAFLTIAETPGLGMRAKEPEFYTQFAGKQVDSFEVTKTGASSDNQINAISGATITSNAVTNAVNVAVYFVKNYIK